MKAIAPDKRLKFGRLHRDHGARGGCRVMPDARHTLRAVRGLVFFNGQQIDATEMLTELQSCLTHKFPF